LFKTLKGYLLILYDPKDLNEQARVFKGKIVYVLKVALDDSLLELPLELSDCPEMLLNFL
jgi:hypothetical protein